MNRRLLVGMLAGWVALNGLVGSWAWWTLEQGRQAYEAQAALFGSVPPAWLDFRRATIAFAVFIFVGSLGVTWLLWRIAALGQRAGERSRVLLRNAGDGVHILDLEGNVIEASDSFCSMLGYPRSQVIGLNIAAWDARFPIDKLVAILRSQYAGGRRIEFDSLHRRADGSTFDVEVSGLPLLLDGEPVMFYSSRDISSRLRIESERRTIEEQYRQLLDALPEGVVLHRSGRIVYLNHHGARLFGAGSPSELLGTALMDRVHPEYADAVRERVRASETEGRESGLLEEILLRLDGSPFFAEVIALPVRLGGVAATLALFSDISARRHHEEEMRLAASVYENTGEAILVTDRDNRIVAVNPAFTRLTGFAFEEVQGRDPKLLASGRHDSAFYREMWKAIIETGQWQGEIWNRRASGEELAEWVTITTIRDARGRVDRRVCIFSDITARKHAEERIWRQAYYDTLTALPNRRLFQDRLQHEIRLSQREELPVALMMIDLDRFKEVNDTLGHEMGDQLLAEAARRIANCVRETDTVARLGGDEFAVILPHMQDQARLAHAAQSVIESLARPFVIAGQTIRISGSVGISTFPADAADLSALMMNADQAMYQAKGAGRNRVAYFTASMQRHAEERIALTGDLRHALSRGELFVAFQPIVDLPRGRICKAEALLRWQHPSRGLVAPSEFIALAEESGLLLEIGEWLFARSLEAVEHWHRTFGRWIQVSINKSATQFSDEPGAALPLDRIDSLALPGNSIAFEITEGTIIRDALAVERRMFEYRARGIEVSIDDFGTGVSSLSRLREIAVDYLKIDRSFVAALTTDTGRRALTEALVVMAHKLGMRVVAEGVETAEQRDLLTGFGCDFAQGFLWSEAVPRARFDELLAGEGDGR